MSEKVDLEPGDVLERGARQTLKTATRAVGDFVRIWLPGHLKQLLVFLCVFGAGAAVYLPAVAAVGLIGVAAVAVANAIVARRQLHHERRVRQMMGIPYLRERQARLRAEEQLDTVALALAGDREALGQLHRVCRPEIRQGLSRIRHKLASARAEDRPQPASARMRRPAPPKPVDTKAIKRRRVERQAEKKALEAEIQYLAHPDPDSEGEFLDAQADFRKQRDAVRQADRVARDRRRRGRTATDTREGIRMGVVIGPEGVRSTERLPPEPTPEKIAAEGGVLPVRHG